MTSGNFKQWLVNRLRDILENENAVLDPADADNLAHVVADGLLESGSLSYSCARCGSDECDGNCKLVSDHPLHNDDLGNIEPPKD